MNATTVLLRAYQASLAAINGAMLMQRWAQSHHPQLQSTPIYLLAIGKAAPAMARGAAQHFSKQIKEALVISNEGNKSPCPFPVIFAVHPVLEQSSLNAGELALSFVRNVPNGAILLVLLSGGASALCEVLPDGLSLFDYQEIMRYLLAQHVDINAINAVRKRLSKIKGGGLLRACPPDIRVIQCSLSDVLNDQISVIGSGPFINENPEPLPELPEWISRTLSELDNTPSSLKFEHHLLAGNRDWLNAFATTLAQPLVSCEVMSGDCVAMAQRCAERVHSGPCGVYLWGGELTVALPDFAGHGGRMQHFALNIMSYLQGLNVHLLAASSDGCDGQSDAAGVLLSAAQINRAALHKAQINTALSSADSYAFWHDFGGQLFCSATETNVTDLIAIIKE